MPILISRKQEPAQAEVSPCNFTDLAQNEFVEEQTTLEELKKRCARYKELLASLQPPQDKSIIRAANFTVDSIQRLIQQSPSSAFLRVYYGIEDSGEPVLFMTAVTEDGSVATGEDTVFVDDCCHCPPMLNCPKDDILDEQP